MNLNENMTLMFVNRTSKRGFSQIKREEYREESVRKHTQFSPKTEQFGHKPKERCMDFGKSVKFAV